MKAGLCIVAIALVLMIGYAIAAYYENNKDD